MAGAAVRDQRLELVGRLGDSSGEILEGDVDTPIANDAYRPYYMHNTSHWLGLDVHDAGSYRVDGEPRPLEPGMVFTVEPWYYNHDEDTAVFVEDVVLVTKDGAENLTRGLPRSPEGLEAMLIPR